MRRRIINLIMILVLLLSAAPAYAAEVDTANSSGTMQIEVTVAQKEEPKVETPKEEPKVVEVPKKIKPTKTETIPIVPEEPEEPEVEEQPAPVEPQNPAPPVSEIRPVVKEEPKPSQPDIQEVETIKTKATGYIYRDNKPLKNAEIELVTKNGTYKTYTDENGYFVFMDIAIVRDEIDSINVIEDGEIAFTSSVVFESVKSDDDGSDNGEYVIKTITYDSVEDEDTFDFTILHAAGLSLLLLLLILIMIAFMRHLNKKKRDKA